MFQLSPRISITGDVLGTCHGFHCLYKNSIKISTQWELHDTRCVNLKTKTRSIMLLSQPIRPLVKNIHGLRSSYGLTAIVARDEIIGTVKKHRVINLLMNGRPSPSHRERIQIIDEHPFVTTGLDKLTQRCRKVLVLSPQEF